VATFSRSAFLGVLAAVIVTALDSRSRGVPLRLFVTVASAVAVVAATALVAPPTFARATEIALAPVSARFDVSQGSTRTHFELLQRGIDEATSSIPHALIGIGYGNSHLMLQDIFPGNKYGNFHSLYVSELAESGIFALLLLVALLSVPIAMSPAWRAIIAGSIAFNVFYQSATDPMFWFMLALAWMAITWQPKSLASAATAPSPA
jgi:O-antigen ligase